MRRFQCDALSKRGHDLLMGQEGKATVGHPFATGHLQGTVGLGNECEN
jgi:hypothetical protein